MLTDELRRACVIAAEVECIRKAPGNIDEVENKRCKEILDGKEELAGLEGCETLEVGNLLAIPFFIRCQAASHPGNDFRVKIC